MPEKEGGRARAGTGEGIFVAAVASASEKGRVRRPRSERAREAGRPIEIGDRDAASSPRRLGTPHHLRLSGLSERASERGAAGGGRASDRDRDPAIINRT